MVFFRPEQFMYPAIISLGAVTTASGCYAAFAWRRRGHLLHPDKISSMLCGSTNMRQRDDLVPVVSGRAIGGRTA